MLNILKNCFNTFLPFLRSKFHRFSFLYLFFIIDRPTTSPGATATDTITGETTIADETTTNHEPNNADEATTTANKPSSTPVPTAMEKHTTNKEIPSSEIPSTAGQKSVF